MCGIAGLIDRGGRLSPQGLPEIVRAMADVQRHRGPDAGDIWVDAEARMAFGHRRLSIIDLSPMGAQPMISADGRHVITYNGEVFNFAELRRELEAGGRRFRGGSDTEVILEGCAAWGADATARRLIGMFAFALWDRQSRIMTLVRDRLGIKPLYYVANENLFAFGSELKVLRACPGWTPEIDRDAVMGYFRHGYIGQPKSIYAGVNKLPPGHVLTLKPGQAPELAPFWDMREVARDGLAAAGTRNWTDAVRRRMVADVPLGAFLSGGIDSSTVVALMQANSNRPIRTFSIGFREAGYDEAPHAKAVARHLGCDHTEFYVEPKDALAVIPHLPEWYDEPFADSSQIPTYLVSAMTRKHVTVALSGDGGDEVFAGYSRYFWADALHRRLHRMPGLARNGAAQMLRCLAPSTWDRLFKLVPARWRPPQAGYRLQKLADLFAHADPDDIYRRLISQWASPESVVVGGHEPRGPIWDATLAQRIPDFTARMQFLDTVTYLPDDILAKVDRATMAVSLEGRVPLLDHRVVEFAWTLPPRFKVRDGKGKWLLRQVLARHVPSHLVERPKMGFGVPIDHWLRGPLRDWAEDLLKPEALAAGGFLRPEPVRALWREHLSGRNNWQYQIWVVLMFQAWRQRWSM